LKTTEKIKSYRFQDLAEKGWLFWLNTLRVSPSFVVVLRETRAFALLTMFNMTTD